MRPGASALGGIVLGIVVCLSTASAAFGKAGPLKCGNGSVPVKVGAKRVCVSSSVALPSPSSTNPIISQVQSALGFTKVSLRRHRHKRLQSFAQRLGHSWTVAQSRLLAALSGMITNEQGTRSRPMARIATASGDCAIADLLNNYGSDPGGNTVKSTNSASIDGMDVTMSMGTGGMQLGIKGTVNGDTFTMKYDSGELSCLAYELPPCPGGDGSLDAFGIKGKTGFSLTVTRAGKVLKSMSYGKTITVETRGQVADDAKLDYVDVKYGETTNTVLNGTRLTTYGNRTTRINMRTGSYDPGESVSFGSASDSGQSINVAGEEADAKGFASFLSQTISAYRARETAWQTPNTCAKLKFDPQSGTITVNLGDQGNFSAEVDANADGARAEQAVWTLSSQQNGTFSPATSQDPQPSFSYEVSDSSGGSTISANVMATSTAGVAQDTWSQKLQAINTISGTFAGHATDIGVIYDWTGTATFTRIDLGVDMGPGGVFQLTSGQATVTVSGSEDGSGCDQTGTTTIGLFNQSPFSVLDTPPPFSYDVIVGFAPDSPQATNVNCSDPNQNGTPAGLGSMPVAALQSGSEDGGSNPNGILQMTNDLRTYSGSASDSGPGSDQTESWTWSLTGSQ